MQNQALADVKVLEFGSMVSAPYCAKLLADLGAEVIKIEEPEVGDEARRKEPFAGDTPGIERSGLFAYLNTNKLGITLNPRTFTGKGIFMELVRTADILVENNPPKVMEQLGLQYSDLEAINPQLVMTSITPFGQSGAYRDFKATELISYHVSGFGYQTTQTYKEPVLPPVKAGGYQSQFSAATNAAVATMCALHARKLIGEGQQVDISVQECMAGQLEMQFEYWTFEQQIIGGLRTPFLAPMMPLRCKDGWVYTQCLEEHHFDNLVKAMGNPEWAKSELFKDRLTRAQYIDALEVLLNDWSMQHTKEEVFHMAQAARVPLAPANNAEDLLNNPHLKAREFFVDIEHPVIGKVKYPGAPYKLSMAPWMVKRPAPLLGEHNEEIYCGRLGYTKQDLVKMSEAGII